MNILRCPKCCNYSIKLICSKCNAKTISTKPPKYSPQDSYGKYRLMYKKQQEAL